VRRFGPTLAGVLLALLTLTSMGPAAAGGPTSALLSVPGEGKTASLYYTDHDYDRLASLVGIEGSGELGRVDESGLGHEDGPGVTVTWWVHDVVAWRVDHIYLEGKALRGLRRSSSPRPEARGTARSSGTSRALARSWRPSSTSWAWARLPGMPATSMVWPAPRCLRRPSPPPKDPQPRSRPPRR